MHIKGSLFDFIYLKNKNYSFIFNYLEFLYYILHNFNYFNKKCFFFKLISFLWEERISNPKKELSSLEMALSLSPQSFTQSHIGETWD